MTAPAPNPRTVVYLALVGEAGDREILVQVFLDEARTTVLSANVAYRPRFPNPGPNSWGPPIMLEPRHFEQARP